MTILVKCSDCGEAARFVESIQHAEGCDVEKDGTDLIGGRGL